MESLVATFTLTFMASEAAPDDETAPLFVYERAMPAMGGRGILMRCRQRKGPLIHHPLRRKRAMVLSPLFPAQVQPKNLS